MANRIRNVKLDRIDLVDAPANPGARVLLVKRDVAKRIEHRNGKWIVTSSDGSKILGTHDSKEDAIRQLVAVEENRDKHADAPGIPAVHVNTPRRDMSYFSKAPTKTDHGRSYPAAAYAYVPDRTKPSSWKLRLWETPEKKETAVQVGRAVAALGAGGFMGNPVELPAAARSAAKAKVRAAWHRTHPGASSEDVPAVLRKSTGSYTMSTLLQKMTRLFKEAAEEDSKEARKRRKAAEARRRKEAASESFLPDDADADENEGDENEGDENEPGSPAHESAEMGHIKALEALHSQMGKDIDGFGDTSKLPADHPVHKLRAAHEALGTHIAERKEALAEARKEAEARRKEAADGEDLEMEAAADEIPEEHMRKMQDYITKREERLTQRVEKAEARAAKAEILAKAEQSVRELGEVKTELRKFDHVPLDIEKEAADFKALRDVSPKAYATLLAKLSAANEVAKTARKLEKDLGSGLDNATGKGSAWAEIEQLASTLLAKGEKGITHAKAVTRVMEQHPELVRKYYEEGDKLIQVQ